MSLLVSWPASQPVSHYTVRVYSVKPSLNCNSYILYFSLHRSLSQEESLRDQFNQTMNNFESRLRARDVDIQQAQRSYDDVVEKLKAVSQERNKLAKQLEESSKNRRKEKERADK